MNKFDRYYKSKNLGGVDKYANTYSTYQNDFYNYKNNFMKFNGYLITNSYSVISLNKIPDNFNNFNYLMEKQVNNLFNGFNDRGKFGYVDTISFDTIINNMEEDKTYKFDNEYSINFLQLKKIIDIIGCKEINILKGINQPVIEIIGKEYQIGYLMPMRVF